MIVSNCLDEIKPENPKSLGAITLEEIELLQSIAKLLYKTKSVRKTISIIDSMTNAEYCIKHSVPPEVMWNNSDKTNEEILSKHEQIPYSGC